MIVGFTATAYKTVQNPMVFENEPGSDQESIELKLLEQRGFTVKQGPFLSDIVTDLHEMDLENFLKDTSHQIDPIKFVYGDDGIKE